FCACFRTFFFSSRRRHTLSKRDWSSAVCSSDLGERGCGSLPAKKPAYPTRNSVGVRPYRRLNWVQNTLSEAYPTCSLMACSGRRSEERRVGRAASDGRQTWETEGCDDRSRHARA